MKKVEFDYWTGCPANVIDNINRAISQYLRYYKDVKVGITGRDPQNRFDEHQRSSGWTRMVIKYVTTSENFANKVESYFIKTRPELKNKWLGKSSLSKDGNNYVYLVMRKNIKSSQRVL